ncbi:MAG: CinA family protein [Nitrospirota bacterium]
MNKEALKTIKKVHDLFKKKKLTLSVAESCTGGLISHYLTVLPGASIFFKAGIIAYSAAVKKSVLHVSSAVLREYGIVSAETAKEMAQKVRTLAKTDFSLSTTGNLGPDVLEGKMQGLVYIAVSKHGKTISRELRLKGNREKNKENASLSALRFLNELAE